jgi:RNA polymerase sigma-70 factor (ECF subfamily)
MGIDVEAAYRKYGPMVLRRCRWMLKDEDAALDAMQDVFVLLLDAAERIKGEGHSSLLYRIATNVCLNRIRSRKLHPETRNEELLEAIACHRDDHKKVETEDFLDRIFDDGKEVRKEAVSTRTIACLHFVDGLTLEETARETGLSVSGVRKRIRTLQNKAVEFKESTI